MSTKYNITHYLTESNVEGESQSVEAEPTFDIKDTSYEFVSTYDFFRNWTLKLYEQEQARSSRTLDDVETICGQLNNSDKFTVDEILNFIDFLDKNLVKDNIAPADEEQLIRIKSLVDSVKL